MPKRPNLFIVGAPKCGTTSLYCYLAEHQDVYMCPAKEPCYLASEFTSIHYPQNEDEYLALFSGVAQQQWVGEATTTYLFSSTAAKRIQEFSPDARILIMLRDPVEMIYSLHQQRLFEGAEDIENFEEALQAEADRKIGRCLPKGLEFPKAYLLYREFGLYAQQVKRYVNAFDRSRIHVIFFEELMEDTAARFSRVCQFLGIKPLLLEDTGAQNQGKTWKNLVLRDFMLSAPARFVRRNVPGVLRKGVKRMVFKEQPREPMPLKLAEELRGFYKEDIQELARVLERKIRWD